MSPIPQVVALADDIATPIAQVVVHLLDLAVIAHHDSRTEESFLECVMCHEWDGHTDACPVTYLEVWLEDQ